MRAIRASRPCQSGAGACAVGGAGRSRTGVCRYVPATIGAGRSDGRPGASTFAEVSRSEPPQALSMAVNSSATTAQSGLGLFPQHRDPDYQPSSETEVLARPESTMPSPCDTP